jgi:hypothetical protein
MLQALKTSTVTSLDLSYAALSANAMPHVSKYLELNVHLNVLVLSGNERIGSAGAAALAEGFEMNRGCREVGLGNTQQTDGSLVQLLASFDNANAVRRLDFSANLLGNGPLATFDGSNIAALAIEEIDFSWNSLNHRHASLLARTVQAGDLLCLKLAWNNVGDMGVLLFCDAVAASNWCALKTLDLSHNKLGPRAIVGLADLLSHALQPVNGGVWELDDLILSGNSFGRLALRFLLLIHLMVCNNIERQRTLEINDCLLNHQKSEGELPSGAMVLPLGSGLPTTNPSALVAQQFFQLELSAVFARAELRVLLLLRTLGLHQWPKATLGSRPMLPNDGRIANETASILKPFDLPTSGSLSLSVSTSAKGSQPLALTAKMENVLLRLIDQQHLHVLHDEDDAADVTFARSAPLRMQQDGVTLIQMLSSSFRFSLTQIEQLSSKFDDPKARANVLAHLGLRAESFGRFWREYVPRLPRVVADLLLHELVPFAFLTDENMTGHYELNMQRPIDRSFLIALIESNEWSLSAQAACGFPDTSQTLSGCGGWRNVTLNGKRCVSIREFDAVPSDGLLVFDYVSVLPPHAFTPIRSNDEFVLWLNTFRSTHPFVSEEATLRSSVGYRSTMVAIAHMRAGHIDVGLSAAQLRTLVHALPKSLQVEAVVALWSRVTDARNFGQASHTATHKYSLPSFKLRRVHVVRNTCGQYTQRQLPLLMLLWFVKLPRLFNGYDLGRSELAVLNL